MEDKRKLAVSYGSFACVIEGFDDPFNLMRDIISFYYQVSQEEPEFAHFHQIVDMQELKALLEQDLGENIELEPIAGGVYARRIEAPARLADDADAPAGQEDDEDHDARDDLAAATAAAMFGAAEAAETEDAETGEDDAPAYGAYGDVDAEHRHDDDEDAEAEDEADEDLAAEATPDAVGEWAAEDVADDDTAMTEPGESEPEDIEDESDVLAASADLEETGEAEEDDASDEDAAEDEEQAPDAEPDYEDWPAAAETSEAEETDEAEEEPDRAPIRLYDALRDAESGQDDDEDEESAPADAADDHRAEPTEAGPIRLSDALNAPRDAEDEEDADEDASEPQHTRLTLGAALRLGPAEKVSGGSDDSDEIEDDGEEDQEPAGAFIDRVAEKDETRELLTSQTPRRRSTGADDEEPLDVSIAQIRSDIEAIEDEVEDEDADEVEDDDKPKKTGGLRMGKLLLRRSASQQDDKPAAAPEEDSQAAAEKPRLLGGGKLRVIRPDSEEDRDDSADDTGEIHAAPEVEARASWATTEHAEAEPEPESEPAPEPEAPRADAPQPQRAPEPEPARAEKPARDSGRGDDPLKDRLHASFGSRRAPVSSKDAVDLTTGEMQDPYSPRGFAQRVGAASVHELIAAAAAFRILVDGKSSVTRTDIMETVQMIMGDKPLTAEAKVKAFGKLVRGGELSRMDGGEFTLSPEGLDSFRERFEAARASNAAGA